MSLTTAIALTRRSDRHFTVDPSFVPPLKLPVWYLPSTRVFAAGSSADYVYFLDCGIPLVYVFGNSAVTLCLHNGATEADAQQAINGLNSFEIIPPCSSCTDGLGLMKSPDGSIDMLCPTCHAAMSQKVDAAYDRAYGGQK